MSGNSSPIHSPSTISRSGSNAPRIQSDTESDNEQDSLLAPKAKHSSLFTQEYNCSPNRKSYNSFQDTQTDAQTTTTTTTTTTTNVDTNQYLPQMPSLPRSLRVYSVISPTDISQNCPESIKFIWPQLQKCIEQIQQTYQPDQRLEKFLEIIQTDFIRTVIKNANTGFCCPFGENADILKDVLDNMTAYVDKILSTKPTIRNFDSNKALLCLEFNRSSTQRSITSINLHAIQEENSIIGYAKLITDRWYTDGYEGELYIRVSYNCNKNNINSINITSVEFCRKFTKADNKHQEGGSVILFLQDQLGSNIQPAQPNERRISSQLRPVSKRGSLNATDEEIAASAKNDELDIAVVVSKDYKFSAATYNRIIDALSTLIKMPNDTSSERLKELTLAMMCDASSDGQNTIENIHFWRKKYIELSIKSASIKMENPYFDMTFKREQEILARKTAYCALCDELLNKIKNIFLAVCNMRTVTIKRERERPGSSNQETRGSSNNLTLLEDGITIQTKTNITPISPREYITFMNQTLYLVEQNTKTDAKITYHCVIPDILSYHSGSDIASVKFTIIIQSDIITSLRVTRELLNNAEHKIYNHIIGYINTESLLFRGLVEEIQSQQIVPFSSSS